MRQSALTLTLATTALVALGACGSGSDPLSSASSTSAAPSGSNSASGATSIIVGSADFSDRQRSVLQGRMAARKAMARIRALAARRVQ